MKKWWWCPCLGVAEKKSHKQREPGKPCKDCGAPPPAECVKCGNLISKPDSLFPECRPCGSQ